MGLVEGADFLIIHDFGASGCAGLLSAVKPNQRQLLIIGIEHEDEPAMKLVNVLRMKNNELVVVCYSDTIKHGLFERVVSSESPARDFVKAVKDYRENKLLRNNT